MTTNTMDKDAGPSVAGEAQDNDNKSEIASLRERLMRALAETENTRRQGERRAQDAGQYAITNFARELLQVVDNLHRAIEAAAADREASGTDRLIEGVAATDRRMRQTSRPAAWPRFWRRATCFTTVCCGQHVWWWPSPASHRRKRNNHDAAFARYDQGANRSGHWPQIPTQRWA
jgi:hypothetical protein